MRQGLNRLGVPRWLRALLLALVVAGWLPAGAQPLQDIPAFTARVIDRTGTLSTAERRRLEDRLAALETRKGSQVAVLIVPTTRPEAIEQYSLRVAEQWKLGRGAQVARPPAGGAKPTAIDDGVLLLVALDDRRIRIEVGYGLEGAIPDGIASRIIDEAIRPRFQAQDWAGGIEAAVTALERRIDGEDLPPPARHGPASGDEGVLEAIVPILMFGFIAGSILSTVIGRFLGAGLAGAGTGFLSLVFTGSALAAGAAAVGVLVLVLLMGGRRRLHRVGRRTYHDGPVILPGGFGGGFGGRGGGGFGGGGFGGGGGGGFGGGGASGGW